MEGSLKELPGILTQLKLATLFRFVLPSCLATFVVYRLASFQIDLGSIIHGPIDWNHVLFLAVIFFVSEFLIYASNDQVYRLYEGRSWWPERLRRRQLERLKDKVLRLEQQALQAADERLRGEYWDRLRFYPLDTTTGKPTARAPTALGNILAGYETYPTSRYGIDSVFFWPRLWLTLDKDLKEEIDQQWATADGLLSLSAVAYLGGFIWLMPVLVLGLLDLFQASQFPPGDPAQTFRAMHMRLPFTGVGSSTLAALFLLFVGYTAYRLSLPFHRANGEVFKSVFDLYRARLDPLEKLGTEPVNDRAMAENWKKVSTYLQYFKVRCRRCWYEFPADQTACTRCAYAVGETLEGPRLGEIIDGIRLLLDALPSPRPAGQGRLETAPTHRWIFTYGSDMSGLRNPAWREKVAAVRPGYLRGYRLAFNKLGRDGTAEANIVPEPANRGSEVWGVCHLLPVEAFAVLDQEHGVTESRDRRTSAAVIDNGGEIIDAQVYYDAPLDNVITQPSLHLTPAPEYLALMIEAARSQRFPEEYIQEIERLGRQTPI
jgi:AIG2-like family